VGLANLGSKSETCVGSRVHFVGVSISIEKNFYRLPFTPPLSCSPYRSFIVPDAPLFSDPTRLLVRKAVPTLTSMSAEIYLSMADAKQLDDTRFILVLAEAVRRAGVCLRHCIALHRDACRGELQARRERRIGL
jgi:hypothetical protein